MRSLTLKLTLAFLFVSIVGVLLVALFVRQRTQSEFDRFVLNRYQIDLIEDLALYYEQSGSWEEISAIVLRMPMRHPSRGMETMPAPVTLVDANGWVIYGGTLYRAGQRLSANEMDHAVPVDVAGETVGWVLFGDALIGDYAEAESPESDFLQNVNQAVILSALGAVGVALLIGILLARNISRPVQEVTSATQVVASGDLGYQVPVRTKDEIGRLAASFNTMSADLARESQLRRQMTADIAHELRTPLSVILGYMEALSSGKLEPTAETFDIVYGKGKHLQHLIDDLRTLAMADSGELSLVRRQVEPALLLEQTVQAHALEAAEKGITLAVAAENDLPLIEVDPERITQVLANLVSNALRYTPADGKITLAARPTRGAVLLAVDDTGSGIDADEIPYLFDRFYRGDRARRQDGASGLGLAIARSIVQAHGGEITVESAQRKGTRFTIRLPAAAERNGEQ